MVQKSNTKYLAIAGSILLGGSLLLGNYSPKASAIGVSGGIVFLVGAGANKLLSKGQKDEESNSQEKNSTTSQYSSEPASFYPESPETAMARRDPKIAKATLEEISKNIMYSQIAEEAKGAAGQYMDKMRDLNPERMARSKGVKVTFNQKENQGLRRFIFGAGNTGYELDINLIDEE